MPYTIDERRKKVSALIGQDPECHHLEKEFWEEREKFERLVDHLPGFLRKRLYGYPTMCYHYHQRIIALLIEDLRFPEES